MPARKECPLCGGSMRLKAIEHVHRVPGNQKASTRRGWEWICPECDYFEETDEAETEGA
jgi:C4-type Zn-finger protein